MKQRNGTQLWLFKLITSQVPGVAYSRDNCYYVILCNKEPTFRRFSNELTSYKKVSYKAG